MLLASTGQPSFYPDSELEEKKEEKEEKEDKIKDENKIKYESDKDNTKKINIKKLKKDSIDFGDKDDKDKKPIFDFH